MSVELNADQLLENAIRDGIREGVRDKLKNGYNSPLDKLLSDALARNAGEITTLLGDCLKSCLGDETFRNDIATAVRSTLAKTLVARFGGELERQVNTLKSDPATRARITVAIEDIVKTAAK